MTGPLVWTSTGTTTSRAAQDRTAEVVNVRDFGAIGNGVADDTAAINAALSWTKANLLSNAVHAPFKLVFPQGRYLVTAPLNFTGFSNSMAGGVIDGGGSEIWAKMSGGVVIDAMGSNWLRFRDLTIYGDPTTSPAIGMQIGRAASNLVPGGQHSFYNIEINGSFSRTSLYVVGSECNGFINCSFRNNATGADRYCLIEDGLNHWHVASTFITLSVNVETPDTFQQVNYVHCLFQGTGSNGVIWMGYTQRHRYIGCYASNTTTGSNLVTIYTPAGSFPATQFLELGIHCETTAPTHAVVVTGAAGATFARIHEMKFEDDQCMVSTSVFAIDPASAITTVWLQAAEINVWATNSALLVDTPSKWWISAKTANFLTAASFNAPAIWTGPVRIGGAVNSSFTTAEQWTSSARPTAPKGSYGYATDTTRFDFYDGTTWQNHVRLSGDTMTGLLTTSAGISTTTMTASGVVTASAGVNTTVMTATTGAILGPTTGGSGTPVLDFYDGTSTISARLVSLSQGSLSIYGAGASTQAAVFSAAGLDYCTIGSLSPAAGAFTSLTASGAATLSGGGTGLSVTNNATVGGTLTVNGAGNALSVANQLVAGTAAFATSVYIGYTGTAAGLILNTNAGIARTITFSTATNSRWLFTVSNTAEAGSNAGSDFSIDRYTDAGAYIASPVVINRASGLVTIGAGGLTLQGQQSLPLPAAAKGGTSYTVAATDCSMVIAPTGTFTLTLPAASSSTGRILRLKLTAAFAVNSASSNVVLLTGGAAQATIMPATSGKFCLLQSDGTNWQLMQAN